MNLIGLVGIALIAAILSIILKKQTPEFSVAISIVAGIFLFSKVMTYLIHVVTNVKGLIASAGISSEYLQIIFKALGICFFTQFSADVCNDAGESALGTKIEFIGKVAVVLVALPLFEDILHVINNLLCK